MYRSFTLKFTAYDSYFELFKDVMELEYDNLKDEVKKKLQLFNIDFKSV